jgi:hypothetical protein
MRTTLFAALWILASLDLSAQTGWDRHYVPLKSGSWMQDKDFYLFTLMEQPAVKAALQQEPFFRDILASEIQLVSSAEGSHARSPREFVKSFLWTPEEIGGADSALVRVAGQSPKIIGTLAVQMRRSGFWIRYGTLGDSSLVRTAWDDAVRWENRIINNYTTNKGFRYPGIDSATFGPSSPVGTEMLGEMLMMLWHHKDSMTVFFQPGLELTLNILFINNRDEPARFEPMDSTNRAAYAQAAHTVWNRYAYSAIVIPGEGPDNDWAMSPMGKYRCQLGAEAYRAGKAPFIIVSGGYVHPFQTPYCEADEMKKYLVEALGIPSSAVILEPHARHTTTNIRNANRIMLRHGFPVDKRVLCVSTAGQMGYIRAPFFAVRCTKEMGYVPFTDLQQIDPFSVTYLMDTASLQMDAVDPLDP